MQSPAVLCEILAGKIRRIPAISEMMSGDLTRVFSYRDAPPFKNSLAQSIIAMDVPSIMIAWMGSGRNDGDGMGFFTHRVSMYVRAQDGIADGELKATYSELFEQLLNGVPAGESYPITYQSLLDGYLDNLTLIDISRIADGETGTDLFESTWITTETMDRPALKLDEIDEFKG